MSWAQLQTMLKENRDNAEAERRETSTVCPYDGSLLRHSEKRNLMSCPMGDFQTTGRPRE